MGTLQSEMNRLAGTTGMDAQGAANVWANSVYPSSSSTTGWSGNARVTIADNGDHIRATLTDATIAALAQNVRALGLSGVPGRTYTATGQSRTNTASSVVIAIDFQDGASASLGTTFGNSVTLNDTTFTQLDTVTATAPVGTVFIVVYYALAATGARAIGQWFDIRRAFVMDGTNGGGTLDLVGALNKKAETSGVALQGVLNILAETQGLDVDGAASRIVA